MSEYNNNAVGASACAYATLSAYNNGSQGLSHIPQTRGQVNGMYIVPQYSVPGYDSLTHGQNAGSCSGFFNITSAYGKGANNCNTTYVKKLCQ